MPSSPTATATLACEGICERVEEVEENKIRETFYDMTAFLTDAVESQCCFTRAHTDPSFIRTAFDETVLTIEKDDLFYLLDFAKVDRLERISSQVVDVFLRDGKQLRGDWVPNDRTSNFYRDSGNRLIEGHLYGLSNGNPNKIKIASLDEIIFANIGEQNYDLSSYPKKIELVDGTSVVTPRGYVVDFCGHWWSSTQHLRLKDECRTMNQTVPLDELAEIVFTGEFDSDHPQCRRIMLNYKDGKEEEESLFLTSESYGGTCNHGSRFRYFDKMFALQDYGVLLVPLDKVRKVVPLSEDDLIEKDGIKIGMNYVSWTRGDYPYTVCVKQETYYDSQGIVEVDLTGTNPFRGEGSLELDLEIDGDSETHRKGEAFIDLRYHLPDYEADKAIKITRDGDGVPLGVDLSDKKLSLKVFCEEGTGGGANRAPSGVQVFLKSVNRENGEDVWSAYYATWQNIWQGPPGWYVDPRLGNVLEDQWSEIEIKIPTLENLVTPEYGYLDEGFDPSCVALVGIKYGLNDNWTGDVNKRIWVDDLNWLDEGVSESKVLIGFDHVEDPVTSLAKSGYDAAAIVQTEFMNDCQGTTIERHNQRSHSDQEITSLTRAMKNAGIDFLVYKPHIDVVDYSCWRGEIDPSDKEEWFRNYTDFIVHYAQMAESQGVEMLAVGTEFKSLVGLENRAYWEDVIGEVRSVYSGQLTYAANWDNYWNVCFWDLVDVVGIDAYFPLNNERDPSLNQLLEDWKPHVRALDQWQEGVGKDILLTEVGYRSVDYAAGEPWEYLEQRPINQELQANCYRAVYEAFKDQPWFKGVLFWDWTPTKDKGGDWDNDFTPQHKLAEDVFLDIQE